MPYAYAEDTSDWDINTSESEVIPSGELFENVTGGIDYGNVFRIFFFDYNSLESAGISIFLFGLAFAICWGTKSLAPIVLIFLTNIIKNTYENSIGVFEQLPINDYIMLAFALGMILLLVIISAEYLTHGDV